MRSGIALSLAAAVLAFGGVAVGQEPAADPVPAVDSTAAEAAPAATKKKSVFNNYSIRIGIESGGPLVFRDTADMRAEPTSVFQFGGRIAFLFGSELRDVHRFGLGVSYNFVAKSETRKLKFTDIYAMYEIGHPLILQVAAGASLAGGTKAFADEYGGLYGALALRYSFIRDDRWSSVSVSPGLVAKSYLVTSDARMTSFFLGAQLEFAYNTNK